MRVQIDLMIDQEINLCCVEVVQLRADLGQNFEGFQRFAGGLIQILGKVCFQLEPSRWQWLVELRSRVGGHKEVWLHV